MAAVKQAKSEMTSEAFLRVIVTVIAVADLARGGNSSATVLGGRAEEVRDEYLLRGEVVPDWVTYLIEHKREKTCVQRWWDLFGRKLVGRMLDAAAGKGEK